MGIQSTYYAHVYAIDIPGSWCLNGEKTIFKFAFERENYKIFYVILKPKPFAMWMILVVELQENVYVIMSINVKIGTFKFGAG